MAKIVHLTHVYQHPLFKPYDLNRIFDAHEKVDISKGDFILHEGQVI